MRYIIETNGRASKSARQLSETTGVLIARRETRFRDGRDAVVINWGTSARRYPLAQYINDPTAVKNAINKLTALRIMEKAGVMVPLHTIDLDTALRWWSVGRRVIQRNKLTGGAGDGIIVCDRCGKEPTQAPLYTMYEPKRDEYRVDVMDGEVIDVSQKRRRSGLQADAISAEIRTVGSGWVFCRRNVTPPAECLRQAIKAVSALGLDFGGVDVGYRPGDGVATVFEVNTAPGALTPTIRAYGAKLRNRLHRG